MLIGDHLISSIREIDVHVWECKRGQFARSTGNLKPEQPGESSTIDESYRTFTKENR